VQTVTFAKPYDHPTETGHLAYPAGFTGEVSKEIADAAAKSGVLKPGDQPVAKPPAKA